MKRGSCGGNGTGTTLTGTGTHMQWSNGTGTKDSGTGTPRLLEYQCTFGTGTTLTGTDTNMRSLQDLSRISILVQGHARLSIPTSRSLMRIEFKPTLGQSWGSSDSRVLALTFGVFSHFSRVFIE